MKNAILRKKEFEKWRAIRAGWRAGVSDVGDVLAWVAC